MLAVKFAEVADGSLWCNGVTEAKLCRLDGFAREMMGEGIGGGWFHTDAILVAAGCRQRTVIP
jgi:hypothetical protein